VGQWIKYPIESVEELSAIQHCKSLLEILDLSDLLLYHYRYCDPMRPNYCVDVEGMRTRQIDRARRCYDVWIGGSAHQPPRHREAD
jgi:hypothetical protein